MRVKTIVEEDFTNYKKPAMFIGTISCGGKCCREAGIPLSVCQNDGWRSRAPIEVNDFELCARYIRNNITNAIVIGGLEPFEQFDEVETFIYALRIIYGCQDDVVIYTGYYPQEIEKQIKALSVYRHIIIKFGRYIPNSRPVYDKVLGVTLASGNQFAERIS